MATVTALQVRMGPVLEALQKLHLDLPDNPESTPAFTSHLPQFIHLVKQASALIQLLRGF
jgi:hypothetical protein